MNFRALLVPAALICFALAVASPTPAEATPKWQLTLSSTDGGSSQAGDVTGQSGLNATVLLQCTEPACYRSCASSTSGTAAACFADCAKDALCNISGTQEADQAILPCTVNLAGDRYMSARALDGGNPNCRVLR